MYSIDEFIRKYDTDGKVKNAIAECIAENMTKKIAIDVLANDLQVRLYNFIDGTENLEIDDGDNVQRDFIKSIKDALSEYFIKPENKKEENDNEFKEIYSMVYDSEKYGNHGLGKYLGKYKCIKQIAEDAWVDDFLGIDENDDLFLILSTEVMGHAGGIGYQVIPLPELSIKKWERRNNYESCGRK